jgi:hypothetical protein
MPPLPKITKPHISVSLRKRARISGLAATDARIG